MSANDHDSDEPPLEVRRGFGVSGPCARFDPGQGRAFRVGRLVLKPAAEPREAEWIGDVLDQLVEQGFRVARPARGSHGSWVFAGWTAWQWVDGQSTNEGWNNVITAGEHLHVALRDVPRPAFLDERSHQWAVGDRVAFGEAVAELPAPMNEYVEQLGARLGRCDLPSQLIHGDLTENVLLADGLAPAVIDFSPYYRPTGYATAVVAVDAIVWSGAQISVIDLIQPAEARFELLARALIFRLVAAALNRKNDPTELTAQACAHRPLVDYTLRLLNGLP